MVTETEVPSIPETVLMMPDHPEKPEPPRTNGDMYRYRRALEQWGCEVLNRAAEITRFATLGQQSVEIVEECSET